MDKVAETCAEAATWEQALVVLAWLVGFALIMWAFGKFVNG